MTEVDRELAAAAEALLGRSKVLVMRKPRSGCKTIHGCTAQIWRPDSPESAPIMDAESTALRRLELDGQALIGVADYADEA